MVIVLYTILTLVLSAVTLVALYVLAALVLSRISPRKKEEESTRDHQIFLHNTGVHIDVVLPSALIPQDLLQQLRIHESVAYIAFGWGDRGFFLETPTWAELKPSVAARAMLVKSPTVMHITDYQQLGSDWAKVPMRAEQFSIILQYLRAGFQLDEQGRPKEIVDKGYTPDDRFFEATGHYHALVTCNVWVNRGLRRAGLRTALWTPHAKGIMRYFPVQEATATPIRL